MTGVDAMLPNGQVRSATLLGSGSFMFISSSRAMPHDGLMTVLETG